MKITFQKTREITAANAGDWRIPSSPIVGEICVQYVLVGSAVCDGWKWEEEAGGGRKGEARRGGGGERATSHLRPPWDILLLTSANKLRILQLFWRLHLLTSLPALVGQGMLPCVARVAHGDRVVTDRVRRRRRPEPEPGVTPSCRASISCTFRSKTL